MLKKLKRFSKNSFKFQFVISYQELTLDCSNDWLPSEICVLWSRKRRKIFTEKHPFVADPLKPDRFTLMWMIPEDVVAKVTMFKDGRRNSFDNKEWTLAVVQNDVVLASCKINLKDYASIESHHSTTTIYLKPHLEHITMAYLIATISCGLALPGNSNEDGQSIASSMSSCNPEGEDENEGADVALMSDFAGFSSMGESNISWFTNGMQEISQYNDEREYIFGNCDVAKMREVSIPSLKYDADTMIGIMQSPGPAESLMEWCVRVTDGYPYVQINDMTTSFSDGMAFCAIINQHRPDLINFDQLLPSNIKENIQLAFDTAEKLGIRSPITAADMMASKIPDKLSVLTFLHQLRQYFLHSKTNSYYHMGNDNTSTDTSHVNTSKLGSPLAFNQNYNKSYLSRSMSPPSSIASPISGFERRNFLNPFDSDEEELDSRCSTYIEQNNSLNFVGLGNENVKSIDRKDLKENVANTCSTNYINSCKKTADTININANYLSFKNPVTIINYPFMKSDKLLNHLNHEGHQNSISCINKKLYDNPINEIPKKKKVPTATLR